MSWDVPSTSVKVMMTSNFPYGVATSTASFRAFRTSRALEMSGRPPWAIDHRQKAAKATWLTYGREYRMLASLALLDFGPSFSFLNITSQTALKRLKCSPALKRSNETAPNGYGHVE